MQTKELNDLPPIPDKFYFTIGEVSKLCKLEPYILRYWEQEFPHLRPARRGNRRYYQRRDIMLIRQIRNLLYSQGFTIEGARAQLSKDDNVDTVFYQTKESFKSVLTSLEQILAELSAEN